MKEKRKIIVLMLSVGLLAGCTFFSKKLNKDSLKIEERVKENNSAALISNQKTTQKIAETKVSIESTNWNNAKLSIEGAETANSISAEFLRRNQNLMGLPIIDQSKVINNLVSTNLEIRKSEEKKQEIKETEEQKLRGQVQELQNKLIEYGSLYEKEKNKSIIKRIWAWTIGTLGIGGLIALCVFFPFLIPIITRIIATIINWIPSLAHTLGLVTKKAAESVVQGIGSVRQQLKTESELKPDKKYGPDEILALFDTQLKIHTDKDDRKIIDNLRDKLKV